MVEGKESLSTEPLMERAGVFVASSTEGLPLAEMLVGLLQDAFDARLWKGGGAFKPGTYPLETFEHEVRRNDFAVIVGTADDALTKRGKTAAAVRDNLVFEFALFLGVLGRRRTFLVVPENAELDLPTDLDGLSLVKYDVQALAQGDRERLHVLQRTAGELRIAMEEQWAVARADENEKKRRVLATARFTAMGRLQDVIVKLRDLLIELPTDALAALGDRDKFNEVRESGVQKVQGLYESWAGDARIVGVESHFETLALATKRAVAEFPYPDQVFVSTVDVQKGVASLLSSGAAAFRAGQSAFGAVREEAASELEARILAVQEQYVSWWEKQSAELRRCTTRLQDALMTTAVSLGIEGAPKPVP
jgi:predicted nucleotide-binding protein